MSVTKPLGFTAGAASAGLKSSGKPDVALVVNSGPEYVAAGVFTTNRVCAAPVLVSRDNLADGRARAVVLNSGGANACTGEAGYQDSVQSTRAVAEKLNIEPGEVLVCSTGLIGERLDMPRLLEGIESCAANLGPNGPAAARAIMTTDTVPKEAWVAGNGWSVGAMVKGAGMIAPAMATMLAVVTTDAVVEKDTAQRVLERAVEKTFNRLDSDGCMSTNDTVLLLCSGASKVTPSEAELEGAVEEACGALVAQMVSDAEGASHEISVTVSEADTERGALEVARAVSRSNLFKTAMYGNDPNWGRIVASVGTVPERVAAFDANKIGVWINGVQVCRDGGPGQGRELVDMSQRAIEIVITLGSGSASATIWTTDLTHAYVEENSAYSS